MGRGFLLDVNQPPVQAPNGNPRGRAKYRGTGKTAQPGLSVGLDRGRLGRHSMQTRRASHPLLREKALDKGRCFMRKWLIVVLALALVGTAIYTVALARHGKLTANMNGAQEIDPNTGENGAGDSDGRGKARITLRPNRDQVCFRLSWRNIGSPTMAHIHAGERGTNGDIVVTLFSQASPLPDSINAVGGCANDVPDETSDQIDDNPGDFYVNVHNQDFPGGAIRGQLNHRPSRGRR
jgi:hypothetical protein